MMIQTHVPPCLENIVLGFIGGGQRLVDEPHLVRLYPLHVLQVSDFSVVAATTALAQTQLTTSIESDTTYLMTVTSRCWPIR